MTVGGSNEGGFKARGWNELYLNHFLKSFSDYNGVHYIAYMASELISLLMRYPLDIS